MKQSNRSNGDRYELFVFDISYFSGKMEAYLQYKEIPFNRHEPNWWTMANVIYPSTGLMKVPVARTPEGEWLKDSTPMIDWFEKKHPAGPVIPEDPLQGFFSRLLEDYADEWLWRPALHYRWSYDADAMLLSRRFAREFLRNPVFPASFTARMALRRQRNVYVKGDGITPRTKEHVEGIYLNTLDRLQKIFERQPFLLGAAPSLADFGFFASMYRHFSLDPTPSRIMRERAPAVYEWTARLWNARRSKLAAVKNPWPKPGTLPGGWESILQDAGEAYLPYLHANAKAFAAGKRKFGVEIQGVRYENLPVVQYRVWCRKRLQDHYEALPESAKASVRGAMEKHGCWEPLQRDGRIPSHLHEGETPPLCRPRSISRGERLRRYFTGTAWENPETAAA